MYYLEVFVIEGYNKHFEALEQLISYNKKEFLCDRNVIYKKKYDWLNKKYKLTYIGMVYQMSSSYDKKTYLNLSLDKEEAGFQN